MEMEAGKSEVDGPEGGSESRRNETPSRMELGLDGGWLGAHHWHKRVAYGSKRSPPATTWHELMSMLEQPGRVAPPEGISIELDVRGAGLPRGPSQRGVQSWPGWMVRASGMCGSGLCSGAAPALRQDLRPAGRGARGQGGCLWTNKAEPAGCAATMDASGPTGRRSG